MGTAPPPDGPPLAQQQQQAVDATFEAGPPVSGLCGIQLPTFRFGIAFNLGAILGAGFPPKLPTFSLSLGITCSEDNPLDITADVAWGGGRVGTADPDPDLTLDQQTS